MRWAFLPLLLGLWGCLDAEAGQGHLRRKQARIAGVVPTDPGPLDRYTWDLVIDGRACPGYDGGVQGLNYQVSGADAGPLAWGYGSDAGTYSCNGSTAGLTNLGAYANTAMVVAGDACWNLNSTLAPAIVDDQDLWCRLLIQTGDNAGNRYLTSFGSSTSDFFGFYLGSTERQLGTARTGALTALVAQTAVLSVGAWQVIDWRYRGANPTNPSWESYQNGAATVGAEHTANLAGLAAGSRLAVGGQSSGQCSIGVPSNFTILSIRCAYGANAAQFTGEALHDADCTSLGLCP